MKLDPKTLRAEQHLRVGEVIQRDASILIERWAHRAVEEQPDAPRLHHDALQDDLPSFLRQLGQSLAEQDLQDECRHCEPAARHGRQRWENGWSLEEVIRDYQILRLVIAEYLEEALDRSLRARESMALGLALDEAITASVSVYVRHRDEHVQQVERRHGEALVEMNRRKDEFLAILGHELRNPLAPIRNALYVLRERGDGATLEWAQGVLDRQVQHMTRLVEDLLDISRLGTGKILLQPQRLDLAELVRTTVEDLRPTVAANGLTLHLHVPDEAVCLTGDPTRLAQVVGNLIGNAVKFTDAGGEITVEVNCDTANQRALLRVKDTGIGIEPALLSRIFEVFVQAESGKERSRGGLGLGLALVKGLVELHGGGINVTSDGPGRGTEFTVGLPLAEGAATPAAEPAQAGPAGASLRVLIVDDNADLADSLRMLLEAYGHLAAVASSGPAALETAARFRPEVVLCDLGLPGMDGYEVARSFQENPETARTVLIAVSGYGSDDDKERCRAAGFRRHFIKPVDPDELRRFLAELGAGG